MNEFRGFHKLSNEQQALFSKAINGENIIWRKLEYGTGHQSLPDLGSKSQSYFTFSFPSFIII